MPGFMRVGARRPARRAASISRAAAAAASCGESRRRPRQRRRNAPAGARRHARAAPTVRGETRPADARLRRSCFPLADMASARLNGPRFAAGRIVFFLERSDSPAG
ncbi:hypothetical protein, partial [Burkholderia thailandensis]|uniref:hypothetical protein n=1 Tax=Burkholderia thailandensis TaxID=57975 RepID=UPI0021CA5A07